MTQLALDLLTTRKPPSAAQRRTTDKWVDLIAQVFMAPVVVHPGGWGDTLPPGLHEEITMQRLLALTRAEGKDWELGTEVEAMAYLYTASLAAPLTEQWTRIYIWLVGRWKPQRVKEALPDQREPDEHDLAELAGLQRHIRNAQRREYRRREAAQRVAP